MTYYFFKQNCAYQLARLLELVLDRPLTAEGKYWVMPVDLVMQLANHTDHEPLYTDVRFHGSRQQALYTHWQQLSTEQQRVIHEILSAPANQAGDLVDTLTQDDAKAVIDTLYDYFSYIDRRQDGLNIRQKEIKRQVMLKRFALPPGQVDWQTSQPAAPHNAQLSTLIQGGISRSEHHTTRLLRFRANYYDLLTYNPGRIPFSELSTFDMTLQVDGNNKVQVQSFKLLNLINLNASQTGLPGDNALAWKLSLGYRQLANDCERCGSLYADGFVGKAWSANSNSVLYGALAVSITGSNRTGGNIAAGVEVGGVAHITPKLTMAFSTGQQWYLNELANIRQYAEIESRWLISQQWDIRATLRYQGQTESGLYLSYYY